MNIKNWFSTNQSALLSEIIGYDGLKIDSGVNQLVSAMVRYQAANPNFNPITASAMPTDNSLQAAIVSTWHY